MFALRMGTVGDSEEWCRPAFLAKIRKSGESPSLLQMRTIRRSLAYVGDLVADCISKLLKKGVGVRSESG